MNTYRSYRVGSSWIKSVALIAVGMVIVLSTIFVSDRIRDHKLAQERAILEAQRAEAERQEIEAMQIRTAQLNLEAQKVREEGERLLREHEAERNRLADQLWLEVGGKPR